MYNLKRLNNFLSAFKDIKNLTSWGIINLKKQDNLASGVSNVIKAGTSSAILTTPIRVNKVQQVQNKEAAKEIPKEITLENKIIVSSSISGDNIKQVSSARKLLEESNIDSDLIATDLFYNDKGDHVQPLANNNLRLFYLELIENKSIDSNQKQKIILNLLAQVILAVELLHKHKLAHRDIKFENFLCTLDPQTGAVKVQITDFDSLIKLKDNGTPVEKPLENFFTDIYAPPDLLNAYRVYKKNPELVQNYDFRKGDLFAIGQIFQEIVFEKRFDAKDNDLLENLGIQLKLGKINLSELKDKFKDLSPISPEKQFFESIEKSANEREKYYDTFYFKNTPKISDPFLILPADLKILYQQVEILHDNLDSINNRIYHNENVPHVEYLSISHQLEELNQQIQNYSKKQIQHPGLGAAIRDLTEGLDEIRLQVQKHPVIMLEKLKNEKKESSEEYKLANKVYNTVADYLEKTRLIKSSWTFLPAKEFHNKKGRADAETLLNNVLSSKNVVEMQKHIDDFINDKSHANKSFSFKTILSDRLNEKLPEDQKELERVPLIKSRRRAA